jgi:hypothetical protein
MPECDQATLTSALERHDTVARNISSDFSPTPMVRRRLYNLRSDEDFDAPLTRFIDRANAIGYGLYGIVEAWRPGAVLVPSSFDARFLRYFQDILYDFNVSLATFNQSGHIVHFTTLTYHNRME